MDEFELDKPPKGLAGDELHRWYVDKANQAAKNHYERKLFEQREGRRKAEAERDAAKAEVEELQKRTPAEGDVVLKGDDAKRWGELKELDLADLKRRAELGDILAEEKRLTQVAADLGLKLSTFTELVQFKQLRIESETKEGEAKARHYALVKGDDGKDQRVDLMTHLNEAYADWLPALTPGQPHPRPPGAPPAGRLPNGGSPRPPLDAQEAFLQQRMEEGSRSVNVLAARLQGGNDKNGTSH